MKKSFYFISCLFFVCFYLCSCIEPKYDPYDVMGNMKPWKFQSDEEDGTRKVYLTVTEEIDFLFWTKNTGEVLYTDSNCNFKPYPYGNEKLSFTPRQEPYVFDFSGLEPSCYVLNIHFKNKENDYKGFVRVFGTVHLKDKVNGEYGGESCAKQARFTIRNDSSSLLMNIHGKKRPGNVMTEFIYVDYVSNSSWYDYKYKTIFRFYNIRLEPGKQVDVLLPMSKSKNVEHNGFLLKKVINDGKEIYYGNTTSSIYQKGFGAPQGGSINNDFIPIENDMFYSDWNWRHN